jgi:hypothetical protein
LLVDGVQPCFVLGSFYFKPLSQISEGFRHVVIETHGDLADFSLNGAWDAVYVTLATAVAATANPAGPGTI